MQIEQWVDFVIEVEGIFSLPRYAVSNFGRIKSFQKVEKGEIIKGSVILGYKSLNTKLSNGKSFNRYVHKVVAEGFLKKPSDKHIYVIHKDYDKLNNHFENLQWATRPEVVEHNRLNPNIINKKRPLKSKQYKLGEVKVRLIKKMIKADTTRLKMIAKQFGITYTQLNRIKTGENWGHVTIED